jgi:hypothetical protein
MNSVYCSDSSSEKMALVTSGRKAKAFFSLSGFTL